MNKITATNKFLAVHGKLIVEDHKAKSEKNLAKLAEMKRKELNNQFTSPIGVTRKSHSKSPAQRKQAKFSRRVNRGK